MQRKEVKRHVKDRSVSVGFGLHVGWAIEGAIGSDFKIDASYLSPNVNLASRIEAARPTTHNTPRSSAYSCEDLNLMTFSHPE